MAYDHLIGQGFNRWTEGTYTPGQIEFINDYTSPAILYTGSYRAGKTEICCRSIIRHVLTFPRAKAGIFRAKLKSLRNSTLRTTLELLHPSWVVDWSNSDLTARLFNGSEISFLGCDFADRIGSIELSTAFIDEAHEVTPESYGMIVGRLSSPLEVDLEYLEQFPHYLEYAQQSVDSRQVLMACNPKSTGHWLYSDFVNGKTRLPGRQCYSSNTLTNQNLPKSYIEQNLAQYARAGVSRKRLADEVEAIRNGSAPLDGMHLIPLLNPFGQRNLLGLWVALEGAIFDWDPQLHVAPSVPKSWADTSEVYVGVDFGYHHPRAVLVEKREENLAVVGYWHGEKSDPQALLDAIERWDGLYNVRAFYLPPDQPGVIQRARDLFGGRVHRADNRVLSGIGTVQTLLNQGRLVFIDDKSPSFGLCCSEMEGYRWKQGKDGIFLDEPLKEADHYCDAVRYCAHSVYKERKLSLVVEAEKAEDVWGNDPLESVLYY